MEPEERKELPAPHNLPTGDFYLYPVVASIATIFIIFLWAAADVILGIVWLVTNRSGKRDCPSCGKSVKRGLTTCQNCNHDFASAASSGTSSS